MIRTRFTSLMFTATAIAIAIAASTGAWAAPRPAAEGPPAGAFPVIHGPHHRQFTPAAGDWEGTANGFPVSFNLRVSRPRGAAGYGINALVVLLPRGCPVSSARYREEIIESRQDVLLGRDGSLGLGGFGFAGQLTGARRGTLSAGTHGLCPSRLHWRIHPARRVGVHDGTWQLRVTGGQTSSFQVLGAGRLVGGLALPRTLTRCDGITGSIDLFITASGRAVVSEPSVSVKLRFHGRSASGTIDAGGAGCRAGPTRVTAGTS